MGWYQDQLLEKAKDLGYRLLPAFNSTTGIPYPRVGFNMLACTSIIMALIWHMILIENKNIHEEA